MGTGVASSTRTDVFNITMMRSSYVFVTVRNSSCGKVMFLQACVKNSLDKGGCLPLGLEGVYRPNQTPLSGRHPTPRQIPLSGRHALR